MIKTIIVGSGNQDKAAEIKEIFGNRGVAIKDLRDFDGIPSIVEDRNTLEGNALKKATELFKIIRLPIISDDTGLEVDALHGEPGVYSARYAGEDATYDDNVQKLLQELKTVPSEQRTARFRTVTVFYDSEREIVTEGSVEGLITMEPRGTNGFGYDPVFEVLETGQTFAEMSASAKNILSHRSRALQKLFLELQSQKVLP